VEVLDPITGLWMQIATQANAPVSINSDGQNIRISNRTGTPVGALLTSNGTGYTAAPTVVPSAGGSTWTAIIGGAITVSVVSGGAGYNYQPTLIVQAPPTGGVPATAIANMSGGAISTVTAVNQGAGYGATLPLITIINDPREATAATPGPTTPAVLSAVAAGSGTITALVQTSPGSSVTGVPTLTVSGGTFTTSATAIAIMDTTVLSYTVTTAGAGFANSTAMAVVGVGGVVTTAAGAIVNPAIGAGAYVPRMPNIVGSSTASGTITATGQVVVDGGRVQLAPTLCVVPNGTAVATSGATLAASLGGVNSYYSLQPM
jgi:hypothetical protein